MSTMRIMPSRLQPRAALAVATLVLAGACSDRGTPSTAAPLPSVQVAGGSAYVGVSTETPFVGDTVVITGRSHLAGAARTASYLVALQFDSAALRYVGTTKLSGMRMSNMVRDTLLAAGASPSGFEDDLLFAGRFVVLRPSPFALLHLTLRELNGVDYKDASRELVPAPGVRRDPR
jgi:hypothetical protein